MKRIITILLMLISFVSFSQVGISTSGSFTPTTTLDVDGGARVRGSLKLDSLTPPSGTTFLIIDSTGKVDTTSVSIVGPTGPTGATGPTGLLGDGSATGNTTYWDGTTWVLNNNNIYNAGSSVGIGTSSPTVKLDVTGSIKTSLGFIANDGGTATPSIRFTNDANSGLYRPGSGLLGIVSSNLEVARFTGGGLNIGVLEVNGQGANNQVIVSNHFQQPNEFWFKRAQGNSTTPLLVNNTSVVGSIKSFAYDGTAYRNISNISFEVDGVSGSGDMPGRIVFSTATDGTTTLTERMRITNSGAVAFGGAANTGTSGQVLSSTGSGSAPIWSTFISPAATVYGTASLSITSATTTWTLVPGLTQTVNIPSTSSVIYIAADLGAQTTSASTTGGSTFDLVLQIDGTAVTNGTYKRVSIMNNGGFVQVYGTTAFSIVTTGLSAGNHTFRVVGIYGSGATATVSSSNAQVRQGSLTVMVLR